MIFHTNRATYKSDLSEEQRREGVEMLRPSRANPAVKSYVVGPELGGGFEYSAVYVVGDLDGHWAYLEFPAHARGAVGHPAPGEVRGQQGDRLR